jgi:hypothetical protein
MTIVDAIDTGLFEQMEQLEQAKQKLRTTYREPAWTAMTQVRADQELTWTIFMAKRVEERLTGSDAEVTFHDPVLCLESGALLLRQASLSTDRLMGSAMIKAAQGELAGCQKTLLTTAKKEGAAQSSSSTSSTR